MERGGVLVWINGPHGSGKTHVAADLVRRVPGACLADPEHVGFGLRRMYPPRQRPDYRDLGAWTAAVSMTLLDVLDRTRGPVIAPQTVTDPKTLDELVRPVRRRHRVVHVTLMVSLDELRRRLRSRGDLIASYAQQHAEATLVRLAEPDFTVHIDTDGLLVRDVADGIAALAGLEIRADRSTSAVRALRAASLRCRSIRPPWA